MKLVLVVLYVVALVFGFANGQVCKDYVADGTSDGSLAYCAGFVNYRYFVQNGNTPQSVLDNAAQNGVESNPLAGKLLPLLPGQCSGQLKKIACLAAFPPCQEVNSFFLGNAGSINAGTLTAVKRKTCRSECLAITSHSTANANNIFTESVCPIISGFLFGELKSLQGSSALHSSIITQINNELGGCSSASISDQTCNNNLFNANLLNIMGVIPDCLSNGVYADGDDNTLKTTIENQISSNGGNCGSFDCDEDVRKAYKCVSGSEDPTIRANVQRSYDVVPDDHVCASFLRHENNQDFELNDIFAARDKAFQLESDRDDCQKQQKLDTYLGTYFIPSAGGQALLGSRVDEDNLENKKVDFYDSKVCPVQFETLLYGTTTRYANFKESTPLCVLRDGSKGYNSRDCLLNKINLANNVFPKFTRFQCRASFLEMTCNQLMMKMELKTLCLVPGGCEPAVHNNLASAVLTKRLPFQFALPRFPSRQICTRFRAECADVIDAALAKDPNTILNVDCEGTLNINQCDNANLTKYGCENPFNGLKLFPENTQTFIDISAPGLEKFNNYQTLVGVNLQQAFQTTSAGATVTDFLNDQDQDLDQLTDLQQQFCECPEPLVVPESAGAETLPGQCCAIPCRSTMHTEEDVKRMGVIQLLLSAIGVIVSLFMVVTWGVFPSKRKQYMTFWLSLCSFNVSFAFFLMAVSVGSQIDEAWCVDNSQPNTMEFNGLSLCTFQAAWLLFWALAEVGWWFCQAADLFQKLVLGVRVTDHLKRKYHIFVWTLPAIATFILLVTRSFGFKKNGSVWCFISVSDETQTLIEWTSFYMFVAILFLAGTISMISVLGVIVRHTTKQIDAGTSSSGRLRARYRLYRTPMLFVLLFIFVWLNIFSFRLLVSVNETVYREEAVAWIQCLLGNFQVLPDPATNPLANIDGLINAAPDQVGCGLTQPGGIPEGSLYLTFIVVMSQSILIFIVFGIQAENFRLWKEALGCADPTDHHGGFTEEQTYSKEDTRKQDIGPGSTYDSSYAGHSSYYGGNNIGGGGFGNQQQQQQQQRGGYNNYGGSSYGGQYGGSSQQQQYGGSYAGSSYGGSQGGGGGSSFYSMRSQQPNNYGNSPPPPPPPPPQYGRQNSYY